MTKSRWGLKLQMQQRQLQGYSASSSTSLSGHSSVDGSGVDSEAGTGTDLSCTPHEHISPPPSIAVDTDVYNGKNGYHHPLVKTLSPIAEQEYVSPRPSPRSEKGEEGEEKSWKGVPGGEAYVRTRSMSGRTASKGSVVNAASARTHTLSGRTASMGSVVNAATSTSATTAVGPSRAASGAGADGGATAVQNIPTNASGPDVPRKSISHKES